MVRLPMVQGWCSQPVETPNLRNRRVVLVGLDWTRDKDPRIPLGQASLAASLRVASAEVTSRCYAINDGALDIDAVVTEVLAEASRGQGWADVGIGVYVWNDREVHALCRGLRRRGFAGRIILGGPQITYHEAGVDRRYPEADALVRGAGEAAIVAIVGADRPRSIPGVVWRGEEDRCEQASADLERLPSPYLTGILDPADHRRFARWETKRGCRFRCSFCQHRDPGATPTVRAFASERVRREVAVFAAAGVEEIAVLDPVFNDPDHPYLEVLDALIAAGFRGRLSLQCRFESVTAAFLDRAAQLDAHLEFGIQSIHVGEWRAIHRGNKMPLVEAAIVQLHARGIAFEVTLIYGLPEQTLGSFRATVQWCLDRRVPVIKAFPLMLLRGTELERDRDRWHLVESDDAIPMVIASDSFTPDEQGQMQAIAEGLIATEGQHPGKVDELVGPVPFPLYRGRWTPLASGKAGDVCDARP